MRSFINKDLEYRIVGCALNHGERAWAILSQGATVASFGTPEAKCVMACLLCMEAKGELRGREYASIICTEAMNHRAKEFCVTPSDGNAWVEVLGCGGEVLDMVDKSTAPMLLKDDIVTLRSLQRSREAQGAIVTAYHAVADPTTDPLEICARVGDMASLTDGDSWVMLSDVDAPEDDTRVATWGISEIGCDRKMDDVMPICAGRHYILSGRPGGGKSSMAIQMMAENAKLGTRCAFISMEMSKGDCYRFFRSHGMQHKDMANISILDSGHLTPDGLSGALKSAIRSGAALVVIDHLAYIKPAGKQSKWEAICEGANRIVEEVKRSPSCAVLSIAQMTKGGRQEEKKGEQVSERPPSMDDIAGGADVGNGAAWIGILWRPQSTQQVALAGEQNVRLRVTKSRFTSQMSVDFRFHGLTHTFTRDKIPENRPVDAERRRAAPISDDEDYFR
jgi:hypothetical protein